MPKEKQMKNVKKIEQISEKIAELQKIQKQIESDFIQDLSKQIAKILIKKKAFNIDKSSLLSKIESVIEATIKEQ